MSGAMQDMHDALGALREGWGPVQGALDLARQLQHDQQRASSGAAASTSSLGPWARDAADALQAAVVGALMGPLLAQAQGRQLQPKHAGGGAGGAGGGPGPGVELEGIVERVRAAAPGMMLVPCSAGGAFNVPLRDAIEVGGPGGYPRTCRVLHAHCMQGGR
jgi:hypothetical protein